MPHNYPSKVTVVDKPFYMYNMKFDRPVTINITYNLSFWAWVFRAIVRRKPLHQIIMVDCHFFDNGRSQEKNKRLLSGLFNISFRKNAAGSSQRRTV